MSSTTELSKAIALATKAHRAGDGNWIGLDWNTDGTESYTETEVEDDATSAQVRADDALEALELGEYRLAAELANEASSLELTYGDDPTWGDFRRTTTAVLELV